jgi:NadR type nicotinamide-nucleotide adenylyltransferase
LVGTLPTEPIPGELRFNWVKNTYINNPDVNVEWCNEVLPQYPEEHPNFWNIWVDVAKKYCPDIDVIFTSEEYGDSYAKHLGIKHHLVDLKREKFSVSGTLSRNETFKYWDFLTEESKPYFVKRIVIMGPESSGKSNLTINLAKHFDTEYVEEYGRTFYEENGNSVELDDFITISIRRQLLEDLKIKKANRILICDTEDITTYYLSKEYHPKSYSEGKGDTVEKFLLSEIDRKPKYDLYILLKPDCEAVQDGTRVFLEERWRHYEIIKKLMLQKNCNFVEIGGSWENRFNQSISTINGSFFSK